MLSTFTLRLKVSKSPGVLSTLNAIFEDLNVEQRTLDIVDSNKDSTTRDITVQLSEPTLEQLTNMLKSIKGVELVNVSDSVFLMHLGGKLEVRARSPIKTRADLSKAYTPGVAKVCRAIHKEPEKAFSLTMKGNTVAVVSDGSRVLSLGDIGPLAAMPVMEGKAVLFKRFANVDAVPICLSTQDTEQIIATVKAIAPSFGGINLEDIASPRCYEIERRLQAELDIPVFHDDQHGTAVVVLAATLNAAKLVRKRLRNMKIVLSGTGAAGNACAQLLLAAGARNIIGFNIGGALHRERTDITAEERWLAERTNHKLFTGSMQEALVDADMFLGLSVKGIIKAEWLQSMKRDPIVFALANPEPEVPVREAKKYARVIATGGSDNPNQINNALVFPGIFRGALDCRARAITQEMKLAAAYALAAMVHKNELHEDYIIPSVFHPDLAKSVANAVIEVAISTGMARRVPRKFKKPS